MPVRVESCFGNRNLATGSVLSGVFSMCISGYYVYDGVDEVFNPKAGIDQVTATLSLIWSIICFSINIELIVAVATKSPPYIRIWICFTIFSMHFHAISVIIKAIEAYYSGSAVVGGYLALIQLFRISILIFLVIVVNSYYHQLVDDNMDEEEGRAPSPVSDACGFAAIRNFFSPSRSANPKTNVKDTDTNTDTKADRKKDAKRDAKRDSNRDSNKDTNRHSEKDTNKDRHRNSNKDTNGHSNKDTNTDTNTDINSDTNTETDQIIAAQRRARRAKHHPVLNRLD